MGFSLLYFFFLYVITFPAALQVPGKGAILKKKGCDRSLFYQTTYHSPLGLLTLACDGTAITGLWIKGQKYFASTLPENAPTDDSLPVFIQAKEWLDTYFADDDILPPLPPLAPAGTPFRRAVWELLLEIPYGTTTTYGALASQLNLRGLSASPRAVGGAVGHNPISILIPCHRVLGADGNLTGYAGGYAAKQFLLELEQGPCTMEDL